MADQGNSQLEDMAVSISEHEKRSLADVEKMRKEIHTLQEKRAAAMMNEVVELQKERDVATGRVKILKQTLEDLTLENTVLKETIGRGDQVQRIFHLEKSLYEEQLYSSDLKKKNQAANKQIVTLKARLKSLEVERSYGAGKPSISLLGVEEDSVLERSLSVNDLEQEIDKEKSGMELKPKGGSPPSRYHLPRINPSKERPLKTMDTLSFPVVNITKTGPPSQAYSPAVIPRRYKLAATQSKSVGTQVDLLESEKKSNPESKKNVTEQDIASLQAEKNALEDTISKLNAKREKESEEHKVQKRSYELLKTECEVLRDGLSEFSRWVRQKIQLVEEDIDICRVIYSLHGSLSQEAALLRELHDRLGESEKKVTDLEVRNRQLKEAAMFTEEKYKQAKKQNALLQEKIVLLAPSKSPKQTFYTSPLTSSPKLPTRNPHFDFGSSSVHQHYSPILRHASKTTPLGGSPGTHHRQRGLYAKENQDSTVI